MRNELSSMAAAHGKASRIAQCTSIETQSTLDAMARSAAGLVASGTATLESAFAGLPIAIVYRVSSFTYHVARRLIRVPHIGMVNLLAGETVAKEFVQYAAKPAPLASEVLRLLDDTPARLGIQRRMSDVAASLGSPGCAGRGAREILDLLS
jgi:lipid-A-disaccharide synthase